MRHSIQSIQVCGSFQRALGQSANWDPASAPALRRAPHAEGEIWSYATSTPLPADFYGYKYYVTFDAPDEPPCWVSDPFARYGGKGDMNAAFVVGGSRSRDNVVVLLAGGRKPLRDLVVSELMIDDFTAEYRGLRGDGFVPHFWEVWQTRFNLEGLGIDTERQLLV